MYLLDKQRGDWRGGGGQEELPHQAGRGHDPLLRPGVHQGEQG